MKKVDQVLKEMFKKVQKLSDEELALALLDSISSSLLHSPPSISRNRIFFLPGCYVLLASSRAGKT